MAIAEDADSAAKAAGATRRACLACRSAIKDRLLHRGRSRASAASRILDGFTPTYESTVTEKLWARRRGLPRQAQHGRVRHGLVDRAHGLRPDVSRPGGRTGRHASRSPRAGPPAARRRRWPARLCPGATGTDTGGSIRQPAALTGIVGIKPTYGRCSRWGIVAFASSLDQAGPMARTCATRDHAGRDGRASIRRIRPPRHARARFRGALGGDLRGKRIGIPKEYREGHDRRRSTALWADRGKRWLRDAGAETVEITLPHTKYALPAYYIIAPAEASSNLARYDGVRYGLARDCPTRATASWTCTRRPAPRASARRSSRRIMIGTYVLSAGVLRRLLPARAEGAYADPARFRAGLRRCRCDPRAHDALDRLRARRDGRATRSQMYLQDVFTVTVNLAGLPGARGADGAARTRGGCPSGFRSSARPFDEAGMLNAAFALETRAGFDDRPERWW